MEDVGHKHDWKEDEHAVSMYSCACGASGRRNLLGRIVELATVARVDPEDMITARPRPADVVDCTGRVRKLNPDRWNRDF